MIDVSVLATAVEKLGKDQGIYLWKRPNIAPVGYEDFCEGQTLFPVIGNGGKLTEDSWFVLTDGEWQLAAAIGKNQDVEFVVANAVREHIRTKRDAYKTA